MLAIIGGSGLAQLSVLEVTHRQVVRTPYGDPSCALTFGLVGGRNVVFIARHGYGHSLAPHEINFRANIWALKQQNIKGIVAIGAVGGIRPDMCPGAIVLPVDVLDYTWGREHTYFEGLDKPVVHVDFTHPYCPDLRAGLTQAAADESIALIDGGVYACTQGPRLESAAEINRLERDGADIVGMTGMPEAALARELGLPYAMLTVVANYAAGRGESADKVDFSGASSVLDTSLRSVERILQRLLQSR
ncbi:MAG: S-methyl-5'-thioinosine phosphorylase [Paludibacterium sp.]|uniref:S-methyl-5'-thioinosine phosphorylase n=1 Tax=Paludibacterium sp. TaxID=1917523 RepID=UPI0025F2E900|nr:S-methyl-5'-thioinosine phosphorylase [Paludibacterium sp.]MBV8048674.1 S-methyl-5'-thioinosine phosphorylase [Paludibacterium sp.]MBV8645979.1 S-methyl-5'-thioinosine phosphorylase [Paludibacterium sp.]